MVTQGQSVAAPLADRLEDIRRLCAECRVRVLEVFGSAATDTMSDDSDIDFLVEFLPMGPGKHADCYFRLLFGLEDLFGRTVDLSETPAIKNPYFLDDIKSSRRVLYAA
jgi:uncharacterized protein